MEWQWSYGATNDARETLHMACRIRDATAKSGAGAVVGMMPALLTCSDAVERTKR